MCSARSQSAPNLIFLKAYLVFGVGFSVWVLVPRMDAMRGFGERGFGERDLFPKLG